MRHRRGCTQGYRQGLGFEHLPQEPTTCLVLTTEPLGFWSAQRTAKRLERGTPAMSMHDLGHAELDLAEFVMFELQEGDRAYHERRRIANERLAAVAAMLPQGAQ